MLCSDGLQVLIVTVSVQLVHSTDASEIEQPFCAHPAFMVVPSASSEQLWSQIHPNDSIGHHLSPAYLLLSLKIPFPSAQIAGVGRFLRAYD
jgi:hypothetical protein